MACLGYQGKLSSYLDDVLPEHQMRAVREHLEFCQDCRKEFDRYRRLQQLLGRLEPVPVPEEAALALRIRLSQEAQRSWWASLGVKFDNLLKPLMLPAATGIVTAVFCFAVLMSYLPIGMPTHIASDVPLKFVTPPRLVNVSPLQLELETGDETVVVESFVDASGRIVDYRILSGPHTHAVMRQLDRMLLFSQFYPATSFGTPIGGRVVLSFRRIEVKG